MDSARNVEIITSEIIANVFACAFSKHLRDSVGGLRWLDTYVTLVVMQKR